MVHSTHYGSPAGWPLRMAVQSEKICGQLFSRRKLFLLTDRSRNWALMKRFHLVPRRKGTGLFEWVSQVLLQHTEGKRLKLSHWSIWQAAWGSTQEQEEAWVQSWHTCKMRGRNDSEDTNMQLKFTKPPSLQRLKTDLFQKVGRHLQQTPGLISFLFFGHIPKSLDI